MSRRDEWGDEKSLYYSSRWLTLLTGLQPAALLPRYSRRLDTARRLSSGTLFHPLIPIFWVIFLHELRRKGMQGRMPRRQRKRQRNTEKRGREREKRA